jgi:hypothetical protein
MQHPRFMQPLHFPFSSRLPRRAVGAACDFFDLSMFLHTQPDVFNLLHKAVTLRACDFLALSSFLHIQTAILQAPTDSSS